MRNSFFWKMVLFSSLVAAISGFLGGWYGPFAGYMMLAAYLGSLTALFVDLKEHEEYMSQKLDRINDELDSLWEDFVDLKYDKKENEKGE